MLSIINILVGGDANTLTCEGSVASSRRKLRALAEGGLSRNRHQPFHIYKRDNWSCCYQSLIMLMSAREQPGEFWRDAPSLISVVQGTMQELWSKGYALEDREVYEGRLVDTTSRIGASVVWYYLTDKLVDAVMVEFITEGSRALFGDFVWDYFSGTGSEHRCQGKLLTSEQNAVKYAKGLLKKVSKKGYKSGGATMRSCGCSMMPLFLLWPGHGQVQNLAESLRPGKQTSGAGQFMGKERDIRAADDLWFGSNGVARDREAAVALFGSLAAGNDGRRGDIIDEAATGRDYGAAPCEDGECCAHRRRRGAAAGDETNNRLNKSICIVGAGPSGLVTLRELAHRGFADVTCYEASSDIGGAFASAYDGAVMTSSNVLTAFGCYPLSEYEKDLEAQDHIEGGGERALPTTEAGMWTCKEYTRYLHAFARRYDLQQYIQTNVEVIYIRALGGERWEVHLRSTLCNKRWIELYDAVCICSGLHQSRNIPEWVIVKPPGRKGVSIMHSSQFNAEDVRDKNVLVIGLGESGSDQSLLASRVAKSVKISFREKSGSGYVLPRYTGGEVSDLNTSRGFGRHNMWGPADYRRFAALVDEAVENEDTTALKELARCFLGADVFSPLDHLAIKWNAAFGNLPYSRFGTKNYSFLEAVCSYGAELVGEVSSWGDVPSDCDAVVLCTGFEARFPFFDSNSHPEVDLGASASNHRERYQHTIDLSVGPSLAFIGYSRPAFGAIPPLSEMAARYWALLLTGERTIGPSARAKVAADIAYEERLFQRDASRLPALVQYHRSMDSLAKLIGSFPPLEELRRNHREVCDRILHSSLSGVQYRLCGEGSMEAAWSDILRHPLPVFTRQPRSAFHAKASAGLFGGAKNKAK